MSQLWKQIERRGVCHYPEFVSSEKIYIVSVDKFETIEKFVRSRYWPGQAEHYRGKTWFLAVFDELSPTTFWWVSSPPFPTVDEAVRFAAEKIPTDIVWEDSQVET